MVGSLTAAQIKTAVDTIKKLQTSSELTETQKASLLAISGWFSAHSSLPGDLLDEGEGGEDEDEETQGLRAAFTSCTRISDNRDHLLRLHSRVGQRHSGALSERGSDTGNGLPSSSSLPSDRVLLDELAKLGSWDFNIFTVAQRSGGHPLEAVGLAAMQSLGLLGELGLPQDKLVNFLRAVERLYLTNPYHSSTHAADVVQTVVAVVLQDNLKDVLTPLELLALLLAAIVHDVGHQGVSNDFLVKTGSEWAITYNDLSPNENFHAATGWKALMKPHNNCVAHLPKDSLAFVRALVVELVLGTDMKCHNQLLSDLRQDIQLFGPDLTQWGATARAHALAGILHCADIGNCVKPLALSSEWARRVNQEFWEQGDRERSLGLPLSPLNDRGAANVPRSQKVFLELFGRPSYEALGRIAPVTGAAALAHCEANLRHWEGLTKQGVATL